VTLQTVPGQIAPLLMPENSYAPLATGRAQMQGNPTSWETMAFRWLLAMALWALLAAIGSDLAVQFGEIPPLGEVPRSPGGEAGLRASSLHVDTRRNGNAHLQ